MAEKAKQRYWTTYIKKNGRELAVIKAIATEDKFSGLLTSKIDSNTEVVFGETIEDVCSSLEDEIEKANTRRISDNIMSSLKDDLQLLKDEYGDMKVVEYINTKQEELT